jgi:hypothetical protein
LEFSSVSGKLTVAIIGDNDIGKGFYISHGALELASVLEVQP